MVHHSNYQLPCQFSDFRVRRSNSHHDDRSCDLMHDLWMRIRDLLVRVEVWMRTRDLHVLRRAVLLDGCLVLSNLISFSEGADGTPFK